MSSGAGSLLCELHAHSRWSDGAFDVPTLVDYLRSRRSVHLTRLEDDTALRAA